MSYSTLWITTDAHIIVFAQELVNIHPKAGISKVKNYPPATLALEHKCLPVTLKILPEHNSKKK